MQAQAESSEWESPKAGCGHLQDAHVGPGFQCPLLSIDPVTVSDPREGKMGCGGREDVLLQFGLQSSYSLLGFPLLKNKHTSEALLEVVPHNRDLQGRFWVGPSPLTHLLLHYQRHDLSLPSSLTCPSLRQLSPHHPPALPMTTGTSSRRYSRMAKQDQRKRDS